MVFFLEEVAGMFRLIKNNPKHPVFYRCRDCGRWSGDWETGNSLLRAHIRTPQTCYYTSQLQSNIHFNISATGISQSLYQNLMSSPLRWNEQEDGCQFMWGSGLSWNSYRNSCSVLCVPYLSVVGVPRARAHRSSIIRHQFINLNHNRGIS